MREYVIPLILRGQVIEDDLIPFDARRGELRFLTPDVKRHADRITLRNPSDIADLYALTTDDIVDFLADLGERLHPDRNEHLARALEISIHTSGLSADMLHSCYAAMGPNLTREKVREIVDYNIGSAMLDGWVEQQLSDRRLAVRAFGGRFVHLNAGNGPVTPLFALINGSLLRCDSIMKSPSNDPYTAVAIARTMIDMAPDHPLTRHVSVAYWKGGDEAFEKQLYGKGRIDKIVAWGGNASMNSIRRYLGPGLDLIALDPKVSISILGAEALASDESMDDAAELLARDFGGFNQEGCLSSRIAYVVSGTGDDALERLNGFGKKVLAALRALPASLSTPCAIDGMLRDEIAGIRYSGDFRVFGCKGDEGGVIVSQVGEPVDFRDRLSGRILNIVPVERAEQALDFVTVHTQTIGIYPPPLKDELRDACLLHGGQRITDLGCALFESMGYPHDGIEILRRMARWGVMESFDAETVGKGTGLIFADE